MLVRFDFAVHQGRLAAAHGKPDVTVIASAADLATLRLGSTEAKRETALRHITLEGDHGAVDTLREALVMKRAPAPRPPTTGRWRACRAWRR